MVLIGGGWLCENKFTWCNWGGLVQLLKKTMLGIGSNTVNNVRAIIGSAWFAVGCDAFSKLSLMS